MVSRCAYALRHSCGLAMRRGDGLGCLDRIALRGNACPVSSAVGTYGTFCGATAACRLLEPLAHDQVLSVVPAALTNSGNHGSFTPVRLPHPLPISQQHLSYLGAGLHTGPVLPTASNTQLAA